MQKGLIKLREISLLFRCDNKKDVLTVKNMSTWARQAWTSKSEAFLRNALLPQAELNLFHQRRAWLESMLCGFNLSHVIDSPPEVSIPLVQPRVLLYGSSIAGTAFEHGDADFAVMFPSAEPINAGAYVPPPDVTTRSTSPAMAKLPLSSIGRVGGCNVFARPVQPVVLNALHQQLQKSTTPPSSSSDQPSAAPHLQRIFRARIPIMQYVPSLDDLLRRQQGHPGLPTGSAATADSQQGNEHNKKEHYDISLSVDGARNSILVRSYMKRYPKLRILVLLLKHWGRQQKILNARRGWISPYALTIMAIHYAKETSLIEELIDPSSSDIILSKISENLVLTNDTIVATSSADGRYGIEELDTVLPFDVDTLHESFADVSDYLRGFFHYYGSDQSPFDPDAHVVDIRTEGRVLKKEDWFTAEEKQTLPEAEQWHRVGYGVLMIRDPYEMHSLGRSVEFFRSEAIRDAMRRAETTLASPDALILS